MAGLQDHRAGRTVLVDLAFWKPGKQHTNMSIRLPMDRAQPKLRQPNAADRSLQKML